MSSGTSAQTPVDDLDALWDLGQVYVPALSKKKWPKGTYARDMAKAFSFILRAGGDIKASWAAMFGSDTHFVRATARRQYNTWVFSSQKERDTLRMLPRTPAGLWTAVRDDLTGHEKAYHRGAQHDG
ncbi:hypothetical protein OH77DRAFT_1526195 [Trametes cingulata]|nr:hypothetical protein OH77DRAFT_1526195 [Trametes cingulata]